MLEGDAGARRDFGVFGRVQVEHERAAAHGLDQRRVRPADFGGVDVCERVGLQLVVTVSVNGAGHHDARVARLADAGDVGLGVGGIANQREFHVRFEGLEGLAHQQRVVFRLHAAHIEEVASGFEPQAGQGPGAGRLASLGPVGNEVSALAVALLVVSRDLLRVADHRVRADRGQALGDQVPGTSQFHFLRFRSRPSTFSATGTPTVRGIQVKTALAALQ